MSVWDSCASIYKNIAYRPEIIYKYCATEWSNLGRTLLNNRQYGINHLKTIFFFYFMQYVYSHKTNWWSHTTSEWDYGGVYNAIVNQLVLWSCNIGRIIPDSAKVPILFSLPLPLTPTPHPHLAGCGRSDFIYFRCKTEFCPHFSGERTDGHAAHLLQGNNNLHILLSSQTAHLISY